MARFLLFLGRGEYDDRPASVMHVCLLRDSVSSIVDETETVDEILWFRQAVDETLLTLCVQCSNLSPWNSHYPLFLVERGGSELCSRLPYLT